MAIHEFLAVRLASSAEATLAIASGSVGRSLGDFTRRGAARSSNPIPTQSRRFVKVRAKQAWNGRKESSHSGGGIHL